MTEILHGGAAEEPVAVVDLVDNGWRRFARRDLPTLRLRLGWGTRPCGGAALHFKGDVDFKSEIWPLCHIFQR
jgi:hypothetical protein